MSYGFFLYSLISITYILGIHDIDYQNSSDTVGASWHDFSDRDSGITHYMWCVQTQSSNQPCDIISFILGIHDIDYQNSSDTVGSSWHGFSDRDSGITHYMWCVHTQSSNQPCDVRDWDNIGIHRSVSRHLNTSTLSTGEF